MKKIISLFTAALMIITLASCSSDDNGINPKWFTRDGTSIPLGSGDTHFDILVTYDEENQYIFHIHTDGTNLGEVLQELELIEGEEGDYGLYIKKVNGITADYDTTGTYWAFYINDEYASTGIDMVEIDPEAKYELRVEQ